MSKLYDLVCELGDYVGGYVMTAAGWCRDHRVGGGPGDDARKAAGIDISRRIEEAVLADDRALRARAMPGGVEWPRFEDGELVRFGDEAEIGSVSRAVNFVMFDWDTRDWGVVVGGEGSRLGQRFGQKERVKRPEVLAADGRPVKVGDVLHTPDGTMVTVKVVRPCGEDRLSIEYVDGSVIACDGATLTHEPPDSWERIEEDAKRAFGADTWPLAMGLVNRARALAGRGE